MRVIDAHVHTWTRDMIAETDIEARKIAAARAGIEPRLDSPVESLEAAMKECGIERAVILPIDSGLNQNMPLTMTEKTDWHSDEVAEKANLITFVGLDPRRGGDGLRELERAVIEKGCKGWKLYPPNGFYPDNEQFYPYYDLCIELKIPIVVHTGFTSRFKYVKYAQPVCVDKVAADFPELRIVLAHVGTPWEDEALMVASKNPNVSVDLSGWQHYAATTRMRLYRMIGDAKISKVFPNRMLFGSDYPLFEHAMPLRNWVELLSNLSMPDQLMDEGYPQVTGEEIERVMWKNAARLFFGERV